MAADWFHIQFSTYGTWLPGCPRGFRSRGGRTKSAGYDPWSQHGHEEHGKLWYHAYSLLKKPPVLLNARQQRAVRSAMLDKIREAEMEVICFAVCPIHVHLLGRFEKEQINREIGRLKRHSSHAIRGEIPGVVWAARCNPTPIENRKHQINAYKYILDHARKERAAVWSFRDGFPRMNAREGRSAGFAEDGSSRA